MPFHITLCRGNFFRQWVSNEICRGEHACLNIQPFPINVLATALTMHPLERNELTMNSKVKCI